VTLKVIDLQSRIRNFSASTAVPFEIEGQIADANKGVFAFNGTYNPVDNNVEGKLNLKGIDLAYLRPFLKRTYSEAVQQGNLTMEATLRTEGFDHISSQGNLSVKGLRIKEGEKLSDTLQMAADFQVAVTRSQETVKIDDLNLVVNGQEAKIQGVLSQWQPPEKIAVESKPPSAEDESTSIGPENGSNVGKSFPLASTKPMERPEELSKNSEVVRESSASAEQGVETADDQGAPAGEPNSTTENVQENETLVLDAQGTLHIDWFHFNKLVASNVDCQLTFRDGKLRLEPLTATVYGGTLGGKVKADSNLPGPPFQSRIYTENILLDEIIKAFWPQTSGSWSGNVNLFYRARGIGTDVGALESRIDVNINEAEFSGHPLFLKFAELFEAEELQQMRFSQVTARAFTQKGVATIKRLHLVGPVVQAEGTGTAGLLDKKLDLHLLLQIRAQYVGKIAPLRDIVTKISDRHGFVRLPLRVSGTLDEPIYGLDKSWLSKTVKKLAAKPVKEKKKKSVPKPPLSSQEQKQLKEELESLVQ